MTKRYRILLLVISLCILTLHTFYPVLSQQEASSSLSLLATPQSPLQQESSPLVSPLSTPTPTATMTPTPIPTPTRRPKPTPVVINEAEGLLREATFTIFVERASGRQEIYYVPITDLPVMLGERGLAAYQAYRQGLLRLASGDLVIYECADPSVLTVPEEYRCFGRKQVTLNTPP